MSLEDRIREILESAPGKLSDDYPDIVNKLESALSDKLLEVDATGICEDFDKESTTTEDGSQVTQTFSGRVGGSPLGESTSRTIGDYQLLDKIAQGGMGVVYRARQIGMDRIVALKLIRSGQLARDVEVDRFYAEARAAGQLKHIGILPVYEVGECENQHFFAMELVEGGSLKDRLRDDVLPPREAAEIVRKVAEAIQHAHDHDIIHRDLKPGNILIDSNGEPKVADFGLAKQLGDDGGHTMTGAAVGTPSYMPPEQAAGDSQRVGPLSDVYSLGAVLYCLLTGRPPFRAATHVETLIQVLEKEPASLRSLNNAIPRDLETICFRCLRKDVTQRYSSAQELADDLNRWFNNEPIRARPVSRFEKSWLWCKRRPVVAGLSALVILIVGIGSGVFIERQNALHSQGLVDSLVKADAEQISSLIDQIEVYGWWTKPLLEERFEAARGDSTEKLHLRLAIVQYDEAQVVSLVKVLMSLRADQVKYVGVIRDALEPYQSELVGELWDKLEDEGLDGAKRFRAGLLLAGYEPCSDRWTDDPYRLLAEQLVATNAVYQPRLWPLLNDVRDQLLDPLEAVFVDPGRPDSQQVAAAHALAVFASGDAERLAGLLTRSTVGQYEILYPKFAEAVDDAALDDLCSMVEKQPPEDLEQVARIALGRERAGAAITLVRQGQREAIFDALRVEDDPEAMTQFVHRCRARGVTASQLVELLDRAERQRQTADAMERKSEERVMFAFLLALGEFSRDEMPEPRQAFFDRLIDWHAQDPSSAVHGATGWLLRHWGFDEEAAVVDRTPTFDHVPTLEDLGNREWFVLGIDVAAPAETEEPPAGSRIYFTFVLFQPGEYQMGSQDGEEYHEAGETLHRVELTRPIAVCDREIVWRQFSPYDGGGHHSRWQQQFERSLSGQEPVFGVNWFEAVAYCRWLTTQAGLLETDQCFAAIPLPPAAASGFTLPDSTNWPLRLERLGFRLLTEAEWEYVCRSGTRSAYSFGNDAELLGNYAWFKDNSSEWSHPVGRLRPNLRGLADIHGNLQEWCYDWRTLAVEDGAGAVIDPIGPSAGSDRSLKHRRGGCWAMLPRGCRAATRFWSRPSAQFNSMGLRLAFSPSAGTSQPVQARGAATGTRPRSSRRKEVASAF